MADEITSRKIAEYLDAPDDFDLDLFAHREITSRGWLAHHGGTYKDQVTGKIRQYDIRGICRFSHGTYVSLAVECKSLSKENPIVLSRVPRSSLDSYHNITKCADDPNVENVVAFSVEKS